MIEEKDIKHLKDFKERSAAGEAKQRSKEGSHPKNKSLRVGATTEGEDLNIDSRKNKNDITHNKSLNLEGEKMRQRVGKGLQNLGMKMESSTFELSGQTISSFVIAWPMRSLAFAGFVGFLIGYLVG